MALLGDNITTLAKMKHALNRKYKDCCRSKYTKDEMFRMTLWYDECLETYEERFQLSCKRVKCALNPKSLKLVHLRGMREDLLETLNLMLGGNIYQLPYVYIKTVS